MRPFTSSYGITPTAGPRELPLMVNIRPAERPVSVKLAPLTTRVMTGPTPMATTRVKDCEAVAPVASVTVTVKFDDPIAVGVPAMAPDEDSVKPAGSDPEVTIHVSGATAPAAARVCEYATPMVPGGRGETVVTTSRTMTRA